MTSNTCNEIISVENLNRILVSRKVDDGSIQELLKLKKKLNGNKNRVKFVLSNGNPGRLYPENGAPSLQSLTRSIRKALTCPIYTDIDICNAHPTIFSQLFRKLSLPCPKLDRYVNERETCLKETGSTRDEAKQAYIKLMYGGKLDENSTPFMMDFHDEFMKNAEQVLGIEEHEIYRNLGAEKKPNNPIGSAISYLAQDIERKCAMTMIDVFKKNGFKVGTIIHDGFLVQSLPENVGEDIMKKAETKVKLSLGYDLKLEKKNLRDFDESELWDDDCDVKIQSGEESETEMARHFIEWLEGLGHRLTRSDGQIYWYDPDNGIYNTDIRQLRLFIDKCPELPFDKRGSTRFQDLIERQVKAIVPDDPDFGDKLIDTTKHKVPFKNGVYCLENKKLLDYNADFYFTRKGSLEYEAQEKAILHEVYEKVFLGVFGTEIISKYFLKSLARAVGGDVEDKLFFIITGRTNSGKSSQTDLFGATFNAINGNYNASNFCEKRTDGDSAKMASWLVPMRNKRVCIANEKPKNPIEGSLIKPLTSGGDEVTARQNNKDEMDFKLSATFYLFCNDTPSTNDFCKAMVERTRIIPTAYTYLLPDRYEASKNEKTGKVPEFVKLADPTLKSVWMKRKEIRQAYAQLVCEAWEAERPALPEALKELAEELLEEVSDDGKIQTHIVVTGDTCDKITIDDLQSRIKGFDKRGVVISNANLISKMRDWGLCTDIRREMDNARQKKIYVFYGVKLWKKPESDFGTDY